MASTQPGYTRDLALEGKTMTTEVRIYINNDLDVVSARMQARQVAKSMGFGTADQARISLAASELARVLSWNTDHPGEIVLTEGARNGTLYLQVACLIDLDTVPLDSEGTLDPKTAVEQNHSLSGACRLVDESIIEAEDDKYTRIVLIKYKR